MTPTAVIAAVLLVLLPSVALADTQPAAQEYVQVHITGHGTTSVSHLVDDSREAVILQLLKGTVIGLNVTDDDGTSVPYNMTDTAVVLGPSEQQRLVQYSLADALVGHNGSWRWDYVYPETTSFFFPDNIDIIYVAGRPVLLDEKLGINCHGCQMTLEFFGQPRQTAHVSWESQVFPVSFVSAARIDTVAFDQPQKRISFALDRPGTPTTIIMPLALLWEPYTIYLNDDPIVYNDNISNQTHVWLSFRPETSGTLTIIGTTAVPEFSLLPLVITTTVAAAILSSRAVSR